ncbi:MAG: glycerol-3-phosphate 1-O-acyltransferase PlsY [Candidatus Omnitrophica bacterium]|nr:glycerol-3-phosphate 1-O-acyltransferase PlsY [Candidatus Omnitrophota bacterium]
MAQALAWGLTLLLSYLLGSVPTGFWYAKWVAGIDIRRQGSGNTGATNVARVLGKVPGLLVLLIDVGKGAVAVGLVGPWIARGTGTESNTLQLLAGTGAILGHDFPIWLRFRGGKGVATGLGVLAALVPWVAAVAAAVWGSCFAVSRFVSLSSVIAALAVPFALALGALPLPTVIFGVALSLLTILRHRDNLRRLLAGQEHRFSFKR